jgi:aspartate/methionine/tyrosine aminotransferase
MALLFGAKPISLSTHEEEGWKLKPETLKKGLTAKSKVLILNNAGNPTGTLYTQEELKELLGIADAAGVFVISDEVYSEIVYDDNKFFSCGELSDKVLVIQSCSKNFAMTGWRVGFAFGPETLIRSLTAIQSQSTTGASIVCQWAALAAFKNHDEIIQQVRSSMQKRRDLFIDTFNKLFGSYLQKPPAALYAFIPLSVFKKKMSSSEVCTEWMREHNIACVPGVSFGKEGYLRMAFSDREEALREGLLALKRGINS